MIFWLLPQPRDLPRTILTTIHEASPWSRRLGFSGQMLTLVASWLAGR